MSKQKIHSPFGVFLNILGTAIIIAVIVLCLMLTVPRLAGYAGYCVLTGSMEPTIPVGSLIYSESVDPASIAEGDVIVFSDGRSDVPITHRVISNDAENGQQHNDRGSDVERHIGTQFFKFCRHSFLSFRLTLVAMVTVPIHIYCSRK